MNQRPPQNGNAEPSTQSGSARRFTALLPSVQHRPPSPGVDAPVAGDILYGADAIATFLFGDAAHRRRVYNLVEKKRIPVFRIGASVCARKSVLLNFISQQEGNL